MKRRRLIEVRERTTDAGACRRCEAVEGVTLAQSERGSVPLCPDCRPRWEVWRDTTGGTWAEWRRRWAA